jgi:hypothetical protein
MIRFLVRNMWHLTISPPTFLLFLVILFFIRQKMFHVTNIIIDAKNSTARHVYM